MRLPSRLAVALPLALLATLVAAAGVRRAVAADEPGGRSDLEVARLAHALAGELMSPFCPGRTLADCPSPDAGAVRDEVRARLRGGESPQAVRSALEARFGEQLGSPPPAVWGWAGPLGVALVGLGVFVLALRRALRRPDAQVAPPALLREVGEELEREISG